MELDTGIDLLEFIWGRRLIFEILSILEIGSTEICMRLIASLLSVGVCCFLQHFCFGKGNEQEPMGSFWGHFR